MRWTRGGGSSRVVASGGGVSSGGKGGKNRWWGRVHQSALFEQQFFMEFIERNESITIVNMINN